MHIVQNLASPEILGRVLALEFCLARLSETAAALAAGRLEDSGRSNSEISYLSAGIAAFFFAFWSYYHISGRGAAQRRFNDDRKEEVPFTVTPDDHTHTIA